MFLRIVSWFLSFFYQWLPPYLTGTTVVQQRSVQHVPAGSSIEYPFEMKVLLPGFITLLDVTLYRTYENELMISVMNAHRLLTGWIDLKQQAKIVLNHCTKNLVTIPVTPNDPSIMMSRTRIIESFARLCYESSCDAIKRLTTDSFVAQQQEQQSTVNVTTRTTTTTTTIGVLNNSQQEQQENDECCSWESKRLHCPDYYHFHDTICYCYQLLCQLLQHSFVTICTEQVQQQLFDVTGCCTTAAYTNTSTTTGTNVGKNHIPDSFSSTFSTSATTIPVEASPCNSIMMMEREVSVLLQILCHDVPIRMIQFRSAIETNTDILHKMFDIKGQYRTVFHQYLQTYQTLQYAPSLDTVQEYIRIKQSINHNPNNHTTTTKQQQVVVEQRTSLLHNKLQKLYQNRVIAQTFALEQQIEEYEMNLFKQIIPFTNLARYLLDEKQVRFIKPISNIQLHADDVIPLQNTLNQLKNLNCQSIMNGNSTTAPTTTTAQVFQKKKNSDCTAGTISSFQGIRSLLYDLQMVHNDDDEELLSTSCDTDFMNHNNNNNNTLLLLTDEESMIKKFQWYEYCVDVLMKHLQIVGTLCQTRHSFRVEKSSSHTQQQHEDSFLLDPIPLSMIRGCTTNEFDTELFRCQLLDWYMMVYRQQKMIQQTNHYQEIIESIRRTEQELYLLTNMTTQSLEELLKQIQQMEYERDIQFHNLEQTIQNICIQEMNLYVKVSPPESETIVQQQLAQPTSSALGIFGVTLQMAGETLPI